MTFGTVTDHVLGDMRPGQHPAVPVATRTAPRPRVLRRGEREPAVPEADGAWIRLGFPLRFWLRHALEIALRVVRRDRRLGCRLRRRNDRRTISLVLGSEERTRFRLADYRRRELPNRGPLARNQQRDDGAASDDGRTDPDSRDEAVGERLARAVEPYYTGIAVDGSVARPALSAE